MSDEIIEVLEYLADKFGIAVDFTNENVVPYLQELAGKYIHYAIATNWFWIILGVVMISVTVLAMIWACKSLKVKEAKSYYISEDLEITVLAVGVFLAILGLSMIMCNAYDLLMCYTFPEKVLFDYVMEIKNSL